MDTAHRTVDWRKAKQSRRQQALEDTHSMYSAMSAFAAAICSVVPLTSHVLSVIFS